MSALQRIDTKRWYASTAAVVAWFALLLQLWLSIELGRQNGQSVLHGVWMYFAFFTILTNLLAAAALAAAATNRSATFLTKPGVVTGIAASIILVSISYNLLLRNTWNPQGWQLVADLILHDVTPLLFVGWWWLAASTQPLRYAEILPWCGYPIAYFVYAMARGAVTGFYPYPFIDVPALGLAQVVINALAILLSFVVLAALLIAIARFRSPRVRA
jgi:hypothetical protein